MIVEQIWTGNAYRNFNYLIACPQTGEALAIDPLDHKKCLALAKARGWTITQILNTHEHGDHTGGNKAMVSATGARVLAHAKAQGDIPEMNQGLEAGSIVKLGNQVTFEVLDTPGHTLTHICLLSHTEQPALFCGDTLFNAGAGNCHNGGHPVALYHSFADQLAKLPEDTKIYPGHDYITHNLKFSLEREPENTRAAQLLQQIENQDPAAALVTTLGKEKEINPFFRLHSPALIAKLRKTFPDLPEKPTAQTVFLRLRELRNSW